MGGAKRAGRCSWQEVADSYTRCSPVGKFLKRLGPRTQRSRNSSSRYRAAGFQRPTLADFGNMVQRGMELDSLKGGEEEARRLLYIAMTRARDELCVSSARLSWIMDEVARAVQAATPVGP